MTRLEQAKIIFDEVDREYSISSYMADDVMCAIMTGLEIIEIESRE